MNPILKTLTYCAEHEYNAMLIGAHGVGKTSLVTKVFTKKFGKMNEGWLCFSGGTLDPWVDFVGTPKEFKGADGKIYLDLLRPAWHDQEIQAIFIDEFNRSHKKVRNAVMELVQFKSINGHKFPNLKVVWAAINPYDEEETYSVDKPDPAQMDRFHHHVVLPYEPDIEYFKSVYGEDAEPACEWWAELNEAMKKQISPRRLDIALNVHRNNGNLRYVLPENCGVMKLIDQLNATPFRKTLEEIYQANDKKRAVKFLADPNQFSGCKEQILKKEEYTKFYIPALSMENMGSLFSEENFDKYSHLAESFKEVARKENHVMEMLTNMNNSRGLPNNIRRQFDDLWKAPDDDSVKLHVSPDMKDTVETLWKESGNAAPIKSNGNGGFGNGLQTWGSSSSSFAAPKTK